MEEKNLLCSSQKHRENKAISFCYECKIYMCNKCENCHLEIFQNHHQTKIDKNKNILEIFSGLCNEKNHLEELNYFCKTHNTLCCVKCIAKIKGKENGQHSDCDICFIEDIENMKKNELDKNIKLLEQLSNTFEKSIDELKKLFDKIDKNKELLKTNIHKIFTKIRNILNDREDKLLLEVDNKFNELFTNENLKNKKLPNEINESLEKGKLIQNQWNNNKLNLSINICLNIENTIKYINKINETLKKSSSLNREIKFLPEENGVNELLEKIENFGYLSKVNKDTLGKLLNENDLSLLLNWIKSDNNKINDICFELCYDAKTNGDDLKTFHKFCDKIYPSVIVVKTESNYIFGGYTKESWENISTYANDPTAFLFSINNQKRIKVKNCERAIVRTHNYGPIFGHGCAYEICIYSPLLSQSIQITDDSDYGEKKYILCGNQSTKPIEIEVYKIKMI